MFAFCFVEKLPVPLSVFPARCVEHARTTLVARVAPDMQNWLERDGFVLIRKARIVNLHLLFRFEKTVLIG